ncbi:P-loop NTPase fold protein [Pseudonocardia sp. MH-G8]|uniref:P-loop NTPase fold protein n=1 Tax=Pseudonocardia sp. MH-G8 TaxID=1854588 RepID=UPI00117AB921|nr:P-loop NTPase fold protein [Pseudonocardia sp. MH-G8]
MQLAEREILRLTDKYRRLMADSFLQEHALRAVSLEEVAREMRGIISYNRLIESTEFVRRDCVAAVADRLCEYGDASDLLDKIRPVRGDDNVLLQGIRELVARLTYRRGYEELLGARIGAFREAQIHLSQAIVGRYMKPVLLETVAARKESSVAIELKLERTEWLTRPQLDRFLLAPSIVQRVDALMANSSSASIGLAGPRGSGKTTILQSFCPETGRSPDQITVRADAPVAFDARDYFLTVFARLCEGVLAESEPESSLAAPNVKVDRDSRSEILRKGTVKAIVAAIVALGAVGAAGAVVILHGQSFSSRWIPNVNLAMLGYLCAVMSIVLALSASIVVQAQQSIFRAGLVSTAQQRDFSEPLAMGAVLSVLLSSVFWYKAVAPQHLSLTVPWLSPLVDPARIAPLVAVASLMLTAWGAINIARHQMASVHLIRKRMSPSRSEVELLGARASSYLREIRYQQTYTATTSGRIASGGGGLVTVEVGAQKQASAARLSWSLPETIGELRKFLAELGRGRRVIVGIDELDKISSSAQAVEFIDSIKVLFNIPGVFFMVSVSTEAMISFERRGIPFRDAFNSAFDDMYRLPYLGQRQTILLLRERVIDIPFSFGAVCHSAAGGLPRESIRYASRLYLMAEDDRETALRLDAACRKFCFEEVLAALNAIGPELAKLDADPYVRRALLCFGETASAAESSSELGAHCRKIYELAEQCRRDASVDSSAKQQLLRLLDEANAQLAFWVTVTDAAHSRCDGQALDFFHITTSLSGVRRSPHPALALEQVSATRAEHGLDPLWG